jgi:hypothetical protein
MMIVKIPEPVVFSVLLGLNLLSVLRFLPEVPHNSPLDSVSLSVPLFFHIFMLVMLYGSGLFLLQGGQPLVILVPTIAAFSLICFCWPYLDRLHGIYRKTGSVLAPLDQIDTIDVRPGEMAPKVHEDQQGKP